MLRKSKECGDMMKYSIDDPSAGFTTNFTELFDIDDKNVVVKYINVMARLSPRRKLIMLTNSIMM